MTEDNPAPRVGAPLSLPRLDHRHDLGPLGDTLPARLCAPPALVPVPLDMIADDWQTPHPVVVGAQTPGAGLAFRYDCWAVTQPRQTANGPEVGISVESELALAGTDLSADRTPRFWWTPTTRVWIERPADIDQRQPRGLAKGAPQGPPVRYLTRALDADQVAGRYGWLADADGWQLVVAASELYEKELAREATAAVARDAIQCDVFVNVVRRRTWWRWATTGALREHAVASVEADGLWLE